MKQVAGFWLPDGEVELVAVLESSPRFYKGPTYQVDKLLACLPWIKGFSVAVDVGAHCGLWSRVLVKCFRNVVAFEPVARHIECFRANVPSAHVIPYALGAADRKVFMREEIQASGNSAIDKMGSTTVDVVTLDGFIDTVDFLKIDCEGFEFFVVQGGKHTIRDQRPCILVEQKKGMGSKYGLSDLAAVDVLKSWGAKERFEMSGDYCLSWD